VCGLELVERRLDRGKQSPGRLEHVVLVGDRQVFERREHVVACGTADR
jgi:hypothetical protein